MAIDIVELLNKRYSTKVFDPDKRADDEKIEVLKEALRLTPSSINSQPWHFFVISSSEFRQKLTDVCWDSNKQKMLDASHIFLFTARTHFDTNDLLKIEELVSQERNEPVNETRLGFLGDFVNSMDEERRATWLKHQVYIAVGQLLMSSAILHLDSCPIEGFSPDAMDDLLGLKEKGLTSVAMVAIGHRHEEDFNQPSKLAKVRFPMEEVLTEI